MKRRDFVKNTSIGLAGASLLPASATAYSNLGALPPLFTEELCPDFVLAKVFAYMMFNQDPRDGSDLLVFEKLANRGGSYHDETVNRRMRFCHPGAYIAMSMFSWKFNRSISWNDDDTYEILETRFHHQYHLMHGIGTFYDLYVMKNGRSNSSDVERSLARNIFCAIEPNPYNGVEQAAKYLAGDFDTKKKLILDLKDRYAKLNPRPEQMHDLDISGASGKGPLNDWYRTLSAQTGAFFLSSHYARTWKSGGESDQTTLDTARLIGQEIELPLRRIGKVRGDYFSKIA